jgi:hypothetical protein
VQRILSDQPVNEVEKTDLDTLVALFWYAKSQLFCDFIQPSVKVRPPSIELCRNSTDCNVQQLRKFVDEMVNLCSLLAVRRKGEREHTRDGV